MSAFVVSKHDIDILVTAHLALNGCAYSDAPWGISDERDLARARV